MKKKGLFKRIGMLLLSMVMVFSLLTACKPEEPPVEEDPPAPYVPPVVEEVEEPLGDPIVYGAEKFKNPYGYASLTVFSRRSYTEDKMAEVANEVEFLDALLDRSKKVIKITADLDMGYNTVIKKLKEAGKSDQEIAATYANDAKYNINSVYRRNPALPEVHPDLVESGIGQLLIQDRDELMIYSETGITIKHLTIWLRGTNSRPVKNIVIRNLVLTDIWEWDEASFGQYDQKDWDYFTIERATDVWIDHITFGNSYDGTADVKLNCKNITFSWLDMDFPIIDSVRRQKAYLDEHIDQFPYYKEVKDKFEGLPEDDFLTYLSSQKKGFNLGNTTDGPGFEQMTVTLHNINAYNLQDRLPRLRKGDAHVYNVLSNSQALVDIKRKTTQNITVQGLVSTEDGAVLMENSRFTGISEPIKTHQESNTDSKYSGKFKIVNSQLVADGVIYTASTPSSVWTSLSSNATEKPFYLRNHQQIPYKYEMVEPYELRNIFKNNHVGAGYLEFPLLDENGEQTVDGNGEVVMEPFNWRDIRATLGTYQPALPVGHKIDSNVDLPQMNIELGTKFVPIEPQVRNFYKAESASDYATFAEGVDYTVSVDASRIPVDSEGNTTQKGVYAVTYQFTSLINPDDVARVRQTVVVFDQNGFSLPIKASDEFNQKIDFTYQANMPSGDVYYLLTSEQLDLESVATRTKIKTDGETNAITTTAATTISGIYTEDKAYLYAFIEDGGDIGDVQRITLRLEQERLIESEEDFARISMQSAIAGSYYKLTKDLDFAGKNNLFERLQNEDGSYINNDFINVVFDGQGHTVKNINIEQIDPGLDAPPDWVDPRRGIFGRANNAVVKNVRFEDCSLSTTKDANHTAFLFETTESYLEVDNVAFVGLQMTSHKSGYVAAVVGVVNRGNVKLNNVSLVDATIIGIKNYNGGLIGGNKTMGIQYELSNIYLSNVKVNETSYALQYAGLVVGRYMGQTSTMSLDGITVYNSKIAGSTNVALVFAKLETGASFVGGNMFFDGNTVTIGDSSSKAGGFVTGNYNTAEDARPSKFVATNVFATANNTFVNHVTGAFTFADKTKVTDGDEEYQEGICIIEVVTAPDAPNSAWFSANLPELTSERGWTYSNGKLVLINSIG